MIKNQILNFSFLAVLMCCMCNYLQAQDEVLYLGAGNTTGMTVTTSSAAFNTTGGNTIDGSGLDADAMEASRFLSHATMGADREMIDALVATDLDFEAWIDNQYMLQGTLMNAQMDNIWADLLQLYAAANIPEEDVFGPYALHFHYAWWTSAMTNEDVLRQKLAYALSQVLVISGRSQLGDYGESLAGYYDILLRNAFGNYRDLLAEVTLHPSMGVYLTHLNNPKTIESENIHPDENYAREILQLFSIGLYELNNDGSRKLDADGSAIPTYDNNDIKELAKVFTGLGGGALADWVTWVDEPYFGLDLFGIDRNVPMKMYNEWHEQGEKTILKNNVIPDGQDGMVDINQAIDIIFNHPNVGPFVSYRLIQRLIKSNPSPAYVNRVATVFNNNTEGVRGDMKSVIKAILLDEEARACSYLSDADNSRLREPLMRYTHVARALPKDNVYDRYWNNGYGYLETVKQMALQAPSVFNFYVTDFQPVGDIAQSGLVAPEFKLHHTTSSIGYLNEVNGWTIWNNLWYSWEGGTIGDEPVDLDTEYLHERAVDADNLLREYDILFSHGQLTDETRGIIRGTLSQMSDDPTEAWNRVRYSLYLFLISPDYVIMR